MRTIWTYAGIGAAILGIYLAQYIFDLSTAQVGTIFVGLCLMALYYEVNKLKEQTPQLKKTFVNDLLFSEPIEPKHNPPKNLTDDGKERWGAEHHDFEFFRVFWFFGEAANRDLEHDSRMRIQEVNSTEISGYLAMEEPAYGRRYEIFYNKVKVGLLQIMAGHTWAEDKSIRAHIEINRVPITALPHEPLRSFLCTIALLLTTETDRQDERRSEYERAVSAIDYALGEAMWNTLHDHTLGEPPGNDLEVMIWGTPQMYFRMVTHEAEKRRKTRADQSSARQSA